MVHNDFFNDVHNKLIGKPNPNHKSKKEEKNKEIILKSIGVFFIIWAIIAITSFTFSEFPSQVLYMCYISEILIGIGILTKRGHIILSQIYILLIPLIIWDIDFLYHLIFNKTLFGIASYFFTSDLPLLNKIISTQHLFTLPLAIYANSLIKTKKNFAFPIAFFQMIIIYILTKISSGTIENVNCVNRPCANIAFSVPYWIIWFLFAFGIIILGKLFSDLIFKKIIKKK